MATKLVVGHQLMGDGSTDYQEICTKADGSKLGHRNGNDEMVHVYGSCWVYDHEQTASKATNSPFHGWPLKGRARTTIVQGRVVFEA